MDGFDAALARYRAFLAHDPITPLLRRSLALLVPGNIRVDTVTAGITYAYFSCLTFSFTLFCQLLTTFLCQRRDTNTDDLTIVLRHNT